MDRILLEHIQELLDRETNKVKFIFPTILHIIMVKKPKVRQEYFIDLREQIKFWDKAVEDSQTLLKHAKLNRNRLKRALAKLNRRYYKNENQV